MATRNYAVLIGVDLVLEVECRSRRAAEKIATAVARTLFDEEAPVACGRRGSGDATITWPTSSREPELRTVGRSDEDGFEAAVPAGLRLLIAAESPATARKRGEAAARRLVAGYASVACRDLRVVRGLVCCSGETVDAEASLLESTGTRLDVRAVSVTRAARPRRDDSGRGRDALATGRASAVRQFRI